MEEKKSDINNNTGKGNTGKGNTGKGNTGHWNTGNQNAGNWNTGNWNVGAWNVGDWNVGNCNSGDCNGGDWNVGHSNVGGCNIGNRNIGDGNVGDWNTGNRNVGHFNRDTTKTIRVFEKECDFELWKNSKKPGFLYFRITEESMDYKEAFKKSYEEARKEEDWEQQYNLLINLPNFDYDIFKEISGIDLKEDAKKEI